MHYLLVKKKFSVLRLGFSAPRIAALNPKYLGVPLALDHAHVTFGRFYPGPWQMQAAYQIQSGIALAVAEIIKGYPTFQGASVI